ncbi:DUF4212 domain-containing protein [Haloterrigena salinisoli]|uniref:DUF4212 domain-containing protein n=1 Tax=Haloterrigena salinisoli TaxID=3132747 RepID=UPI0030CF569A
MADNNSHDTDDGSNSSTNDAEVKADGGVASGSPARAHQNTDYLSSEVNLLNPSTQFMRDHLRLVWSGFAVWFVVVFGPVTLTRFAPDLMTTQIPMLGFPLHYFLVAIGGPTGALLLSFWYARKRDALDAKYGIDHAAVEETGRGDKGAAATDGGVDE